MNKYLKITMGLFLVIIGVIGILSSYDVVNFSIFSIWTYVWFALGVIFEVSYFTSKEKNVGFLIVGGILMVIGGMFVASSMISWRLMGQLWPLFIMAPGFGLLQAYLFHEKRSGYLVSAGILIGFSMVFLNLSILGFGNYTLMSVALIGLGLILIVNPKDKKKSEHSTFDQ